MILDRIKEYLDYRGISIAAFERSIGMSNASFGKSLKNGGAIGTDKLETILRTYNDISAEWLLRGEGEMLRGNRPPLTDDDYRLLRLGREFFDVLSKIHTPEKQEDAGDLSAKQAE
jgi:hypothetical protein